MPLVQRVVQPVDIVRIPLSKQYAGDNELQSVSMNALVGVLHQLASLSKHAESLFADLFNEASFTMTKARNMELRVQNLAKRVAMDTNVCNHDLNNAENGRFKHDVVVDQNVVTKDNRTLCIQERYGVADTTPKLVVFKNIRDDGKDYTTMYTDPHFFSKTWLLQMQKEYDSNNRRGKTRKKRRNSMKKQPRAVTIKTYTFDHLGNKIVMEDQRVCRVVNNDTNYVDQQTVKLEEFTEARGEKTQPPLQATHIDYSDNLPPPPPDDFPLPPPVFEEPFNLPPPETSQNNDEIVYDEPHPLPASSIPVAPPPPLAPAAPPPPAAPMPPPISPPAAPAALKPVPKQTEAAKPKSLLDCIQNYSKGTLKKVTVEPKAESHYASMDVMSILNRRGVMQVSDSESDSGSSCDDWEED